MTTIKHKVVPHLWFDQEAREAAEFYCSIFPGSEITDSYRVKDTPSGDCEIISFSLSGQPFQAISAGPFFQFNESISFIINCESQDEVDHYWDRLSAVPESEQCGWLKDKFGISWQIIPTAMEQIFSREDEAGVTRATQAMLKMKKLDIATLESAYRG